MSNVSNCVRLHIVHNPDLGYYSEKNVLIIKIQTGKGVTDPKNRPRPHMCYHIKFGSSATKGVHINRKKPPKLGSAGTPPPSGGAYG